MSYKTINQNASDEALVELLTARLAVIEVDA
jgi:hypothetical protein